MWIFSLLDFNFNSNRIQTWIWGWVMQILPNRLKYLQRLNIKGGVKVAGFKGARINMPQATQWIMERVVINVRLAQIRLRTTPWAVEHLKAAIFAPPPTSPSPNNPQPFSNSPHSPLLWMWEKLKLMFHINSCPLCSALSTGEEQCNIWTVYNNYLDDVRNWYRCSISAAGRWLWPYKVAQIIKSCGRIVECVLWCGGEEETISVEIEILISPPRSQGDCFVFKERCVKTIDILDHCHVYLIQPKE